MKIRVLDVPPEGQALDFNLEAEALNKRVSLAVALEKEVKVNAPAYSFTSDPEVHMDLQVEGTTVILKGEVKGEYQTVCSRCAEDSKQSADTDFHMILKPHSERSVDGAEEEDLNFGIYESEEIDCTELAEEFLLLSLPFTVLCEEDCKGLCAQCGQNLNSDSCACKPEETGDPRLSVLRQLKLTH